MWIVVAATCLILANSTDCNVSNFDGSVFKNKKDCIIYRNKNYQINRLSHCIEVLTINPKKQEPVFSEWKEITDFIPKGMGTITKYKIYNRREGSIMRIRGSLTTGTVFAADATLDFKKTLNIKYAALPTELKNSSIVGEWLPSGENPDPTLARYVIVSASEKNKFIFYQEHRVLGGTTKANQMFKNLQKIDFFVDFPIEEGK